MPALAGLGWHTPCVPPCRLFQGVRGAPVCTGVYSRAPSHPAQRGKATEHIRTMYKNELCPPVTHTHGLAGARSLYGIEQETPPPLLGVAGVAFVDA